MALKEVRFRLFADDNQARDAMDKLTVKLKELTDKFHNVRIGVDDKGAKLKIDSIALAMQKLDGKVSNPKVDLKGFLRAQVEIDKLDISLDRLNAKSADPRVGIGGWGKFLSTPGGWGAFLGKGPGANQTGAGGFWPFMGSPVGLAVGGAALGAASPLIVSLLGGLVGGAGLFGAMKIASSANTNLQSLQGNVSSAQQALQQAKVQQQFNPSAQNAYAVTQAQQALAQAQQAAAAYQKQNAGSLNLYGSMTTLGHNASTTFMGALSSNATRSIDTSRGIENVPVGGTSFISGVGKITNQMAGFVKTLGPALGNMFRASLPYIKLFVLALEDFAKSAMPAITGALNRFKPYMADMLHFFNGISYVITGVIQYFGLLAEGVGKAGTGIMRFVHNVEGWWRELPDTANHIVQDILGWFARLPSALVTIGRSAIQGLINGLHSIPIVGTAMDIGGKLVSTFKHILGIASPSKVMYGLGAFSGEGLALGLDSKTGRVMSAAAGLARGIPGSAGSATAGRGGAPLNLTLTFAGGGSSIENELFRMMAKQIRVHGGDSRILLQKVRVA